MAALGSIGWPMSLRTVTDVSEWRARFLFSLVWREQTQFNLSLDVLLLKNSAWGPSGALFRSSQELGSM